MSMDSRASGTWFSGAPVVPMPVRVQRASFSQQQFSYPASQWGGVVPASGATPNPPISVQPPPTARRHRRTLTSSTPRSKKVSSYPSVRVPASSGYGGLLELASDPWLDRPLPPPRSKYHLIASLAVFALALAALIYSAIETPAPKYSGSDIDYFRSVGWALYAGGLALLLLAAILLLFLRAHPFHSDILVMYYVSLVLLVAGTALRTAHLRSSLSSLVENPAGRPRLLAAQLSWIACIGHFIYVCWVLHDAAERPTLHTPTKEEREKHAMLVEIRRLAKYRTSLVHELATQEAVARSRRATMDAHAAHTAWAVQKAAPLPQASMPVYPSVVAGPVGVGVIQPASRPSLSSTPTSGTASFAAAIAAATTIAPALTTTAGGPPPPVIVTRATDSRTESRPTHARMPSAQVTRLSTTPTTASLTETAIVPASPSRVAVVASPSNASAAPAQPQPIGPILAGLIENRRATVRVERDEE